MTTVAYISNEFPSAVEWYVGEEIRELRRRGVRVVPCSARQINRREATPEVADLAQEALHLQPLHIRWALRAAWLAVRMAPALWEFARRILCEGTESWPRRVRAVAHTALGVCYAERLRGRGVEHIHAHHGYYASWVAMVAAKLLDVPFSLTLHGSDLLVHGAYLDIKLRRCAFCIVISEFNRRHVAAHFPEVDQQKILVQRLGVEIPPGTITPVHSEEARSLTMLSVGRLHAVKDHQFLLQACFFLKETGLPFQCCVVGEGPERRRLEYLIRELHLQSAVHLLGAVPHAEIGRYYDLADLVVLTSRSEGIPLVLMEAMARGKLVLAPAITGIPELVIDGKSGFLYPPDELEEFVWRVDQIARSLPALTSVRRAARERVRTHFAREKNLHAFAETFLERTGTAPTVVHADSVLQ